MHLTFKLHPLSQAQFQEEFRVQAEVVRDQDQGLILRYSVYALGNHTLTLPPKSQGAFKDGLWKTTCFEAFIQRPFEKRYVEYNFSPSTDYAVYQFDEVRTGMRPDRSPGMRPKIEKLSLSARELKLTARLPILPHWVGRLGLATVIEVAGVEDRLYYALNHHSETPDFHDPRTFIVDGGQIDAES